MWTVDMVGMLCLLDYPILNVDSAVLGDGVKSLPEMKGLYMPQLIDIVKNRFVSHLCV